MRELFHIDIGDITVETTGAALVHGATPRTGVMPTHTATQPGKAKATLPSVTASLVASVPGLALAQSSPFMTGATALQSNILAWLTPVAIILVMVLGAMAMAARMSWGWCIGAILGIAMAFGAPQIVTWVRGMFGV
jgi:type IV secretion system protein VirB2